MTPKDTNTMKGEAMTAFRKASRAGHRLKVGVSGPSGAGKTLGALSLAHQLASAPDKVAVLDTENDSASLYSDTYPFDVIGIEAPYLSAKYQDGIEAAVAAGYEALVIDSISHQWDGSGGILQRKEEVDARGGNHFSNWAPFTKEHNAFRAALLSAPLHLICTMRSKQAYQVEEGGKKAAPKKLGLQPIQREGMEYEFTLCFDVQMDHKASASKDRTRLFADKLTDLTKPAVGKALLGWLASNNNDGASAEQKALMASVMASPVWSDTERQKVVARFERASASEADDMLTRAIQTRDEREGETSGALLPVTA